MENRYNFSKKLTGLILKIDAKDGLDEEDAIQITKLILKLDKLARLRDEIEELKKFDKYGKVKKVSKSGEKELERQGEELVKVLQKMSKAQIFS